MKKPTLPVRTCSHCGEEKPLAAFLQLSGSQGTVYGNICSTCRSEKAKNKQVPTDEERGKNSGLRIDSNAKVQIEAEQKRHEKKRQETAIEDLKNRDDLISDKSNKIEKKEKAEKHHRNFLDSKNRRGFLTTTEKKIAQTKAAQKDALTQHEQHLDFHKKEETQKIEDVAKQEALNNTTDYSSGVSIDPGIGGIRFQVGGTHERLEAILGKSGFLNRLNQQRKQEKAPPPQSPTTEKDPLVEYIKDNLKPSSTRRR